MYTNLLALIIFIEKTHSTNATCFMSASSVNTDINPKTGQSMSFLTVKKKIRTMNELPDTPILKHHRFGASRGHRRHCAVSLWHIEGSLSFHFLLLSPTSDWYLVTILLRAIYMLLIRIAQIKVKKVYQYLFIKIWQFSVFLYVFMSGSARKSTIICYLSGDYEIAASRD